uniref:DsrE family protein n=1 Tax=Campylobacter fetus TaxID=196 RepID=UPI003AF42CF5
MKLVGIFMAIFIASSSIFAYDGNLKKDINVVIFLTKKDNFQSAILQANGIQKSLSSSEKGDIELVMGGSSVEIFAQNDEKSNKIKNDIAKLVDLPNVRVVACRGAMKRANVSQDSLIKGVNTVKAAPREVVDRQLDGYAILNP